MDDFTETHSKMLLSKEWLVKVDAATSTPYLFKFVYYEEQAEYAILASDTKRVWAEVLSRKHTPRRWKQCNRNLPMPDDAALSTKIICAIHSPSGISDSSFEVVESPNADLSFELEFEGFKWRWDAFLLGPRTSSDILSKHLIMPLITMAHVAFYSADPVSELSEEDLEKVVDKIGRTARRSVDTHVKHTISKPRIATSLQRVSALLGIVSDLPSIRSELQSSDLGQLIAQCNSKPTLEEDEPVEVHSRPTTTERQPRASRPGESSRSQIANDPSAERPPAPPDNANADSETEPESDDGAPAGNSSSAERVSAQTAAERRASPKPGGRHTSTHPSQDSLSADRNKHSATTRPASPTPPVVTAGSSSPSPPPPKKPKTSAKARVGQDSDSDSGDSRAGRNSQAPQSNAGAGRGRGATRGVRQPLKRGAKRF